MIDKILFYFFASVLVVSAIKVVSSRNPVHAALFLILAFFTSSALWILLEAEFLAIILVLVYVGAVMVLFLFVVMMLDINLEDIRAEFVRYLPVGIVVGLIVIAEIVFVLIQSSAKLPSQSIEHVANYSNTKEIGALIYSNYLYAFELAAAVLLVALVAAVALVLRKREGSRRQNISKQVTVRAADRMHLVDLKSEKKPGVES